MEGRLVNRKLFQPEMLKSCFNYNDKQLQPSKEEISAQSTFSNSPSCWIQTLFTPFKIISTVRSTPHDDEEEREWTRKIFQLVVSQPNLHSRFELSTEKNHNSNGCRVKKKNEKGFFKMFHRTALRFHSCVFFRNFPLVTVTFMNCARNFSPSASDRNYLRKFSAHEKHDKAT